MFVNPWHAGRVKDAAQGQGQPVISKAVTHPLLQPGTSSKFYIYPLFQGNKALILK